MTRYRDQINCSHPACGQTIEVEFTEATRKLRITCPYCGQLNQVEIILHSDKGGPAGRFGVPAPNEKIKIVVLPSD